MYVQDNLHSQIEECFHFYIEMKNEEIQKLDFWKDNLKTLQIFSHVLAAWRPQSPGLLRVALPYGGCPAFALPWVSPQRET